MLNDYIDRIIARLKRGWTKGAYARDANGRWVNAERSPECVYWCLEGAAWAENTDHLLSPLIKKFKKVHGSDTSMVWLNDHANSVDEVIGALQLCKD
jgi:hypothetical protein